MPLRPALTRRSVMLAKPETVAGTDAQPDPTLDSFLVADAAFSVNASVLERNFYRASLSGVPIAMGRKISSISFKHELKGSGDASRVSKFGTLLRACGFAQTLRGSTAGALISDPVPDYYNKSQPVTWAKTAAPISAHGRYTIRVVKTGTAAATRFRVSGMPWGFNDTTMLRSEEFSATVMCKGRANPPTIIVDDQTNPEAVTFTAGGGAWAAGDKIAITMGGWRAVATVGAAITATSVLTRMKDALNALPTTAFVAADPVAPVLTVNVTAAALTNSGAPLAIGQSGATLTPTLPAVTLPINEKWTVDLTYPGWHYTPVSTGFETFTFWMYYDGNLHRLTGCIGSVSVSCDAGQYAMATFTITGQYTDPEDAELPLTSAFEPSKPQQVELAELNFGMQRFIRAANFSVDMGITVNPRDSVSHPDGYDGMQYTGRAPTGGLNPEMETESAEPYWKSLATAKLNRFHGRVGTIPGNIVRIVAPAVQLRSIAYADRNNNRVYDMSTTFSQDTDAGDDEIRFIVM